MNSKQFKMDLAGRELKIEIGRLAQQANGAVLASYGGTVVLVTCVMSKEPRQRDYLPLSVEYTEKFYAAGKIKSSRFLKREGRPSDEAILTSRMIDRIIRPLFNHKIRNEIQVVPTVLSFDKVNDPDIPALIATSLSLAISDIPWDGPVAALRVAHLPQGDELQGDKQKQEKWAINPSYSDREQADLDLIVAGRENKVNMLEGEARQVKEEVVLEAIGLADSHLKKLIEFQNKIIQEVGLKKMKPEVQEADVKLVQTVKDWLANKLEEAVYQSDKQDRLSSLEILQKEMLADLVKDDLAESDKAKRKNQITEVFEEEVSRIFRYNILEKEKRPDGRKLDEIRPIECQAPFLERLHGSALFQRGETQALSLVTLGAPSDAQIVDSMEIETTRCYMHHYNFLPFCTGETGRIGAPGRREIGHGTLAEKALLPLIPSKEEFPYTIRVVSEILSSNGSSSMASTCGSSLALMDAGVPIKAHVAGVALGLVMDSVDKYKILTDIQGPEDHYGDMDCKIAGTKQGVTAIQMDVKMEGVSVEMFKEFFEWSRKSRLLILEKMEQVIEKPRANLSPFAPCILTIKISRDKIGTVIGPGGKVINEIIEQTGVKIDIDDDGLVNITSESRESGLKALEWVKNLTREVKAGEVFQGKIVKITDFGAFVEILPGHDGLLHISELADHKVRRVEDVLKLGQMVPVKVKDVDNLGRVSLTLKSINNINEN